MSDIQFVLKRVGTDQETDISGELVVGRLPESGLVLTEGHPSRRHAILSVKGSSVVIEDLESANGTFVNDVRIASPVVLSSGDHIRFDTEAYLFEARGSVGANGQERTVVRKPEPAVVEAPGSSRSTPQWIDPNKHVPGGPKTQFIDFSKVSQMIDESQQSAPDAGTSTVDRPTIYIASGDSQGGSVVLALKDRHGAWTVGSDSDRDIILGDKGVSGVHAKITFDGQRWRVADQMSANGTFVNGKRSNMSYLNSGDRLRFGPVECELRLPRRSGQAKRRSSATGGSGFARNAIIAAVAFALVLALVYAYMTFWR